MKSMHSVAAKVNCRPGAAAERAKKLPSPQRATQSFEALAFCPSRLCPSCMFASRNYSVNIQTATKIAKANPEMYPSSSPKGKTKYLNQQRYSLDHHILMFAKKFRSSLSNTFVFEKRYNIKI